MWSRERFYSTTVFFRPCVYLADGMFQSLFELCAGLINRLGLLRSWCFLEQIAVLTSVLIYPSSIRPRFMLCMQQGLKLLRRTADASRPDLVVATNRKRLTSLSLKSASARHFVLQFIIPVFMRLHHFRLLIPPLLLLIRMCLDRDS